MATRKMISTRKRIRQIAIEAGFQPPRLERAFSGTGFRVGFSQEGNSIGVNFEPFDDGRESCYDVKRGKAHTSFVKLMKAEYGDAYEMTQHDDYHTTVWLRKAHV